MQLGSFSSLYVTLCRNLGFPWHCGTLVTLRSSRSVANDPNESSIIGMTGWKFQHSKVITAVLILSNIRDFKISCCSCYVCLLELQRVCSLAVVPLFLELEPIPSSERDSISTEFYSPKNPGMSQGRDCTDRILLGWDWNRQSLGMGLDS